MTDTGVSRRVRALAVALAGFLIACATRPHQLQPSPARNWAVVRDSAQRASASGHFEEADRSLAEFARRYPSSPEAGECMYWRALLMLDPANPAGPGAAASAFDAYLRRPGDLPHRNEALSLRAVALRLDSLSGPRAKPAEGANTDHADAAHEEELKKLRLELKATQEELDRIKRRLVAPKP